MENVSNMSDNGLISPQFRQRQVELTISKEIAVAPYDLDNRPPWDPLPDSANPVCDNHGKDSLHSKMSQKIFKGIWPLFCDAVKENRED